MNIQERIQRKFQTTEKEDKNVFRDMFTEEQLQLEGEYNEQKNLIDPQIKNYIEHIAQNYPHFKESALYRLYKKVDFKRSLAEELIQVLIKQQEDNDDWDNQDQYGWQEVTSKSKHVLIPRDFVFNLKQRKREELEHKKKERQYSPSDRPKRNINAKKRNQSAAVYTAVKSGNDDFSRERSNEKTPIRQKQDRSQINHTNGDRFQNKNRDDYQRSNRDSNTRDSYRGNNRSSQNQNQKKTDNRQNQRDQNTKVIYVPKNTNTQDQETKSPYVSKKNDSKLLYVPKQNHDETRQNKFQKTNNEEKALYQIKANSSYKTPEKIVEIKVKEVATPVQETKKVDQIAHVERKEKSESKVQENYQMFEPSRPTQLRQVNSHSSNQEGSKPQISPQKAVLKEEIVEHKHLEVNRPVEVNKSSQHLNIPYQQSTKLELVRNNSNKTDNQDDSKSGFNQIPSNIDQSQVNQPNQIYHQQQQQQQIQQNLQQQLNHSQSPQFSQQQQNNQQQYPLNYQNQLYQQQLYQPQLNRQIDIPQQQNNQPKVPQFSNSTKQPIQSQQNMNDQGQNQYYNPYYQQQVYPPMYGQNQFQPNYYQYPNNQVQFQNNFPQFPVGMNMSYEGLMSYYNQGLPSNTQQENVYTPFNAQQQNFQPQYSQSEVSQFYKKQQVQHSQPTTQ